MESLETHEMKECKQEHNDPLHFLPAPDPRAPLAQEARQEAVQGPGFLFFLWETTVQRAIICVVAVGS